MGFLPITLELNRSLLRSVRRQDAPSSRFTQREAPRFGELA
jgi:hypothetical protein